MYLTQSVISLIFFLKAYNIFQLTTQDHLDGGISLLIRCAGSEPLPNLSPEKIPIDVYIMPHELQETQQRIGGDLAVLVQALAQEFAVPHLQHFATCCLVT
jgi:hypothetical protein